MLQERLHQKIDFTATRTGQARAAACPVLNLYTGRMLKTFSKSTLRTLTTASTLVLGWLKVPLLFPDSGAKPVTHVATSHSMSWTTYSSHEASNEELTIWARIAQFPISRLRSSVLTKAIAGTTAAYGKCK